MNLKNSLYKVEPTSFNKDIYLPGSKSHANRALIIGALRGKGFEVHNTPASSDVTTLLDCLETVGVKLTRTSSSVIFHDSFPSCESEVEGEVIDLKTGDGGTTNRFLMALLSRGHKTYRFFPSEKMNERPIDDLIEPLRKLGVIINPRPDGAWLSLKGPARPENITSLEIDCQKSTQFASAMMLAFCDQPLTITCKNVQASETYLLMTREILRICGQKNRYDVPVDFSSLGYPVALALVKSDSRVLIKNCKTIDSLQADSALIELMRDCGGDIQWSAEGLLVTSNKTLKPFSVDGSAFPDLVPTLAFLASHIEGKSMLRNLSVLRHKESDRLNEIMNVLKEFSVSFTYDDKENSLSIEGQMNVKKDVGQKTLIPARDHRMVMISYLFLRTHQGGLLAEADCVEKSFPGFFNIM